MPAPPSRSARIRFVALVLLGYAYVLGMLLLLTGVCAGLLASHVYWPAFAVGAAVVAVARSLRLKFEPPEGVELAPAEVPRLDELIEQTRRRLRAPRITAVIAVEGVEAYVTEIPRLGVLGWNRIYLVVGLPYLVGLSPEELEAVIAHELAHLSRRDVSGLAGLRGSLIRWRQLEARLDERDHWSGFFFQPFLRRYLPRLERATLAFRRWSEYEADRIGAKVAGVDPSVTALLRAILLDRHLAENVWDDLAREIEHEPKPPAPFELVRAAAATPFRHPGARLAERAREVESDWTHPALSQRLRAIGVSTIDPSRLSPPRVSAADVYLGAKLDDLLRALDARWREGFAERWRDEHAAARTSRARLEELRQKDDRTLEERRERAGLVRTLDGLDHARRLYEALFAEDAGDAVSAYWVGRALVEAGDEHGLTLLERSVELDQHSTQAAADVAVPFLVDHYRFEEADAWSARALEYVVRAAEAGRERSRLRSTDEVEPHGLPDDAVESLRAAVAGVKGVKRAYLVRKRCNEFPDDEPVWILGLKPRPKHFRYERRSRNAALVKAVSERLQPSFEGLLWIAPLAGGLATLEAAMAATPGALLLGKRSRTARAYAPIGWRGGFAAAVVIVGGFFGIMWLVTSRSGPPPPGYGASPAPEAVTPAPTSRWGRAATMRCARAQTAYTASVGRGAPMLDARLRLERDFLTVLATTPGAPAGREAAVRLARKRVALFARAIGLKNAGETAKAQAFFERYAATSARRAVAALDAPSCAT